jgi:hypothetical protein
VSVPIEAMTASELAATGSVSTGLFHTFVRGKIGHFGADGSGWAPAAHGKARVDKKRAAASR